MSKLPAFFAVFVCLFFVSFAFAQEENPHAVATFECLGLYYTVPASDNPGECAVRWEAASGAM